MRTIEEYLEFKKQWEIDRDHLFKCIKVRDGIFKGHPYSVRCTKEEYRYDISIVNFGIFPFNGCCGNIFNGLGDLFIFADRLREYGVTKLPVNKIISHIVFGNWQKETVGSPNGFIILPDTYDKQVQTLLDEYSGIILSEFCNPNYPERQEDRAYSKLIMFDMGKLLGLDSYRMYNIDSYIKHSKEESHYHQYAINLLKLDNGYNPYLGIIE